MDEDLFFSKSKEPSSEDFFSNRNTFDNIKDTDIPLSSGINFSYSGFTQEEKRTENTGADYMFSSSASSSERKTDTDSFSGAFNIPAYEPFSQKKASESKDMFSFAPVGQSSDDKYKEDKIMADRYTGSSSQSRIPQSRTPQTRTPQGARPASARTPQGARPAPARNQQNIRSTGSRAPQGTRAAASRAPQGARVQNKGGFSGGGKGKGPSKKIIILASVLVAVVLLFGGLFAWGYSAMGGLDYDDSIVPNAYVEEKDLVSDSNVTNILFLGCDGREDVSSNLSDTMILFSVDKQNKKIKLTSFLRDSYVYIPSKGYSTKLNASFTYGGPQLVMDTIEYNFGVDIDYYLMVDFTAFKTVVNLLGGITVDGVTAAEAKYMKEVVKIKSQDVVEGTNEMSGNTALWYCRIRYLDNDFKRTERQRKVISAIVDKALKTNIITLFDIVEKTVPHISTDMTRNKLLTFGMSTFTKLLTYDMVQQQIPAAGTWSDARISGQLVLKMDMEENRAILKSFLYDKETEKVTEAE